MGKLLIDVLKLEKEGLFGFTDIGEQILLKEIPFISTRNNTESAKEELIKKLTEKEHIKFMYEDSDIVNYAVYKER